MLDLTIPTELYRELEGCILKGCYKYTPAGNRVSVLYFEKVPGCDSTLTRREGTKDLEGLLFTSDDAVLKDSNSSGIIFDLSGLEYITSEGVSLLLSSENRAIRSGKPILLTVPSDNIKTILIQMGVIKVFEFYESVEQAIAKFEDKFSRIQELSRKEPQ